jgi:hypothetical protein
VIVGTLELLVGVVFFGSILMKKARILYVNNGHVLGWIEVFFSGLDSFFC